MTSEASLSLRYGLRKLSGNDRLIAFNLFDPSVV